MEDWRGEFEKREFEVKKFKYRNVSKGSTASLVKNWWAKFSHRAFQAFSVWVCLWNSYYHVWKERIVLDHPDGGLSRNSFPISREWLCFVRLMYSLRKMCCLECLWGSSVSMLSIILLDSCMIETCFDWWWLYAGIRRCFAVTGNRRQEQKESIDYQESKKLLLEFILIFLINRLYDIRLQTQALGSRIFQPWKVSKRASCSQRSVYFLHL